MRVCLPLCVLASLLLGRGCGVLPLSVLSVCVYMRVCVCVCARVPARGPNDDSIADRTNERVDDAPIPPGVPLTHACGCVRARDVSAFV